jgi:hypothetical protein
MNSIRFGSRGGRLLSISFNGVGMSPISGFLSPKGIRPMKSAVEAATGWNGLAGGRGWTGSPYRVDAARCKGSQW